MSTYKITNITNTLGKREFMNNSTVNIEYVDNMMKKSVPIQSGAELFLSVDSLPLSIHRLRIKNLITVVEVSEEELVKSKIVPAVLPKPVVEKEKTTEEQHKVSSKKKSVKKDLEIEE